MNAALSRRTLNTKKPLKLKIKIILTLTLGAAKVYRQYRCACFGA